MNVVSAAMTLAVGSAVCWHSFYTRLAGDSSGGGGGHANMLARCQHSRCAVGLRDSTVTWLD